MDKEKIEFVWTAFEKYISDGFNPKDAWDIALKDLVYVYEMQTKEE